MEEKLDRLSEAIVALARVEEKIVGLERANSTLMDKIIKNDDRLSSLEIAQYKDGQTIANLRSFFWILVSAIVSAVIWAWTKGFSNSGVTK